MACLTMSTSLLYELFPTLTSDLLCQLIGFRVPAWHVYTCSLTGHETIPHDYGHACKCCLNHALVEAQSTQQLSVVISSIYWSLIILLPHLILPATAAPNSSPSSPELYRIPLTLDLALHAVPCLSLVLDFFCFEKKYDKQNVKVGAPIAAFAFSLWYTLWVEHCAQKNNGICEYIFACRVVRPRALSILPVPYPFLTENDLTRRVGIYVGATFIAILSFRLINYLHH